eukprot:1538339-Amphidinium_carterae.1
MEIDQAVELTCIWQNPDQLDAVSVFVKGTRNKKYTIQGIRKRRDKISKAAEYVTYPSFCSGCYDVRHARPTIRTNITMEIFSAKLSCDCDTNCSKPS